MTNAELRPTVSCAFLQASTCPTKVHKGSSSTPGKSGHCARPGSSGRCKEVVTRVHFRSPSRQKQSMSHSFNTLSESTPNSKRRVLRMLSRLQIKRPSSSTRHCKVSKTSIVTVSKSHHVKGVSCKKTRSTQSGGAE